MVRGLDAETCIEFCNRLYEATGIPLRVRMETKAEMKSRGLRSPDLADVVVVGFHTARKRGLLGKAPSKARERNLYEWDELEKEFQDDESLFTTEPFNAVM